jgi:hypothetical protein
MMRVVRLSNLDGTNPGRFCGLHSNSNAPEIWKSLQWCVCHRETCSASTESAHDRKIHLVHKT